jgi:hypothetical protein
VAAFVLLEGELYFFGARPVQDEVARLLRQLALRHVLIDLEVRRQRVQDLMKEGAVVPLLRLDRALLQ